MNNVCFFRAQPCAVMKTPRCNAAKEGCCLYKLFRLSPTELIGKEGGVAPSPSFTGRAGRQECVLCSFNVRRRGIVETQRYGKKLSICAGNQIHIAVPRYRRRTSPHTESGTISSSSAWPSTRRIWLSSKNSDVRRLTCETGRDMRR